LTERLIVLGKNYAVAVLDIGTSGVRMLVGRVGENGTPKIIAKADANCRGGIKRIDEYDRGGLQDAIVSVVDSIKMKTGLEIHSCYVNLRNDYIHTFNNEGNVSIKEDSEGVTDSDIGELLNDASSVDLSDDEILVDVIPLAFYADGATVKEELHGIKCNNLKVDANVVVAETSAIRKIEKILSEVGLDIDGYVPTFFAKQKVLPSAYFSTSGKKSCFVLVADIGSELSEYTVYYNGIPFVFNTVNIGGANITKDLSIVLNISQNEAERLKLDYPIASSANLGNDVEIAIFPLEKGEKEMVNISYVVDIMQARIKEMTAAIINRAADDLKNIGINVMFDRVVLIGEGIARFSGINDALDGVCAGSEIEVLNIGRDIGMKNTYSIATGMLLYVSSNIKFGRTPSKIIKESQEEKNASSEEKISPVKSIIEKVKSWFVLFKE
jgi:cell division protein FtsA